MSETTRLGVRSPIKSLRSVSSITTVVLVALGMGAGFVGMRSITIGDVITRKHAIVAPDGTRESTLSISTGCGQLVVQFSVAKDLTGRGLGRHETAWYHATQSPHGLLDLGWTESGLRRLGFAFVRPAPLQGMTYSSSGWFLGLPIWCVACALLFHPIWRFMMWWWRQRRPFGRSLCPQCGYDTRCNERRCSECGTPKAGRDHTQIRAQTQIRNHV
jgi:hypothetical protein